MLDTVVRAAPRVVPENIVPPAPRQAHIRGAAVVVQSLVREGLNVFFGIPGGAISPVVDALLDVPEARVVLVRHEAEAVFAACGHYLAGGAPAVVFVTSGPGATNALTGIASARCDGIPLVVLVGEVPRPLQGRGALQDGSSHHLDIAGVGRRLAKECWEATSAHALPALVRRAVRAATSGRPGPVILTLPLDVQSAETIDGVVASAEEPAQIVASEGVVAAARLLQASRRAIVLAGAGLRGGDGPAALLELATRYQIPVITTPKGKGVFPESHPLCLGVFGIGGHPSASAYLGGGVDVLLALGTSFGDLSTEGWSELLVPERALIHVDVDGTAIGRHYAASLAVVGPAAPFLRALAARLERPRPRIPALGVTRLTDPAEATDGEEGRISPARALWELQHVLPEDSTYVIDSGEHFLFAAHYLRVERPEGFLAQTGLGSMGSSLGAAIGAQLACPARRVAAIMGDGGFGMTATQIADAVAAGLPITACVFNDERLAMCELGHANVFGRTPAFPTPPVDVVMMARAMGADALRVEHTGDILRHAPAFAARRGPLVVDVRIDRSFKLPKKDRIGALGKSSRAKEV
jgi:acetolactate synthase-1/2/3 large subunit